MWLFLGISAIIFTGFNLIYSFKNKNEKWFRFAALSFTALTVCSFYSDGAMRVLNEDWGYIRAFPAESSAYSLSPHSTVPYLCPP